MYNEQREIIRKRESREYRVRSVIKKSCKLRLSVFRSAKHIYAQIIDDIGHKTLVAASSCDKEIKDVISPKEIANEVGKKLALLAKNKNIDVVVFDRGKYKFHGRIAALALGARDGGLKF